MAQCPKCGAAVEMVGDLCMACQPRRRTPAKKIKLHVQRFEHNLHREKYRIENVENSLEWHPGYYLSPEQLERINLRVDVNVLITGI